MELFLGLHQRVLRAFLLFVSAAAAMAVAITAVAVASDGKTIFQLCRVVHTLS
jgi:hypothetical protein